MNQRFLRRPLLTDEVGRARKLLSCCSIPALHALSRLGCPEIQFWFLRAPCSPAPRPCIPLPSPRGVKGSPPSHSCQGLARPQASWRVRVVRNTPGPQGLGEVGVERGLGDLPRVYLLPSINSARPPLPRAPPPHTRGDSLFGRGEPLASRLCSPGLMKGPLSPAPDKMTGRLPGYGWYTEVTGRIPPRLPERSLPFVQRWARLNRSPFGPSASKTNISEACRQIRGDAGDRPGGSKGHRPPSKPHMPGGAAPTFSAPPTAWPPSPLWA